MKKIEVPLVSLGSPLGIGYEIFLKSIKKLKKQNIPLFCIGSKSSVSFFMKLLKIKRSFLYYTPDNVEEAIKDWESKKKVDFFLLDIDDRYSVQSLDDINPKVDGHYAYKTLEQASELLKKGYFKSIVTLPVNKNNINKFDKEFFGHTEFFQKRWNERSVYMTFVSKKIVVMLLTTHIPLAKVSDAVTFENIYAILKAANSLRDRLSLKKGICFLGVNPHAGEDGIIGAEDLIIKRAIDKFNIENSSYIAGPLPADTAFIKTNRKIFDIFISCYHDQGLIPFKMLSFKDGVNLSYGMNIVRTSVDHGTAIDLIGKGRANIKSFLNAYNLAVKLS